MFILASASPRRRELLSLIVPEFRVIPADADETLPASCPLEEVAPLLARRKALAVWERHPQAVVIGSDTVVVLEDEIFGKPQDAAAATAMLRRLAGRRHSVYTGVAVADAAGCKSFNSRTEVEFAPLTEEQIQAYVRTGDPMDKAGAYGIQGKGALFVRAVYGDFYTVMGLPVCRLAEFLQKKYDLPWNL